MALLNVLALVEREISKIPPEIAVPDASLTVPVTVMFPSETAVALVNFWRLSKSPRSSKPLGT